MFFLSCMKLNRNIVKILEKSIKLLHIFFFKFQDYQVDLYLRQHWDDPRLNNPAITEALDLNDPRLVQVILSNFTAK